MLHNGQNMSITCDFPECDATLAGLDNVTVCPASTLGGVFRWAEAARGWFVSPVPRRTYCPEHAETMRARVLACA